MTTLSKPALEAAAESAETWPDHEDCSFTYYHDNPPEDFDDMNVPTQSEYG